MRQKKLLCHKFLGICFPPSYSSHLPLSYHPMQDDLCHLPMSHVHHYTLLFKTRDIADSHTRLIHHFTCHIFSILRLLKSLAISSGLSWRQLSNIANILFVSCINRQIITRYYQLQRQYFLIKSNTIFKKLLEKIKFRTLVTFSATTPSIDHLYNKQLARQKPSDIPTVF